MISILLPENPRSFLNKNSIENNSDEQNLISLNLENEIILNELNPNPVLSLNEDSSKIILALHLVREDVKLDSMGIEQVDDLSLSLAQLTLWMSWSKNWINYYSNERIPNNVNERLFENWNDKNQFTSYIILQIYKNRHAVSSQMILFHMLDFLS